MNRIPRSSAYRSGLAKTLFFRPNCRMLCGDAKSTVTALAAQFED